MKIVIFAHPYFLKSESMPRFASMLEQGFIALGHQVTVARPRPVLHALLGKTAVAKWAGYFDQYLLFPFVVKYLDLTRSRSVVFVLADQALGPWARYIKRHRIVAHCLDLLAMKSALGVYPANPVKLSGRIYQRYLRWGYQVCDHFICISKRTAEDLVRYGSIPEPKTSVVYLGFNYPYMQIAESVAIQRLNVAGIRVRPSRFLLFVGGGQWYKNRRGVIGIYAAYAATTEDPFPLICVSPVPDAALQQTIEKLPNCARVEFIQSLDNEKLQALYSSARLTLFPSLAEGFGWPIVEAQACGCPVLTTDDAPMNEIAGPVTRLLRPLQSPADLDDWSKEGAALVVEALAEDDESHAGERQAAIAWASRFRPGTDVQQYLAAYHGVVSGSA